jgi:hypothetical protein
MPYRRNATLSALALATPLFEQPRYVRRAADRSAPRGGLVAVLLAAVPSLPAALLTGMELESAAMGLVGGGLAFVLAAPLLARALNG